MMNKYIRLFLLLFLAVSVKGQTLTVAPETSDDAENNAKYYHILFSDGTSYTRALLNKGWTLQPVTATRATHPDQGWMLLPVEGETDTYYLRSRSVHYLTYAALTDEDAANDQPTAPVNLQSTPYRTQAAKFRVTAAEGSTYARISLASNQAYVIAQSATANGSGIVLTNTPANNCADVNFSLITGYRKLTKPQLSDNTVSHWYRIEQKKEAGYVWRDPGNNANITMSSKSTPNNDQLFRFVATDEPGAYRVESYAGRYVSRKKDTSHQWYMTEDQSNAIPAVLIESYYNIDSQDDALTNYTDCWQFRSLLRGGTTNNANKTSEWSLAQNSATGLTEVIPTDNNTRQRVSFTITEAEPTLSVSDATYIQPTYIPNEAKSLRKAALCGKSGEKPSMRVKSDVDDETDYKWRMQGSVLGANYMTLVTQNNQYLAWSEDDGFTVTDDAKKAVQLRRAVTTYAKGLQTRYELHRQDDDTQVLTFDTDGALLWKQNIANTPASILRFAGDIADTPVMPHISMTESPVWYYFHHFQSNNTLTDTGDGQYISASLSFQDSYNKEQCWRVEEPTPGSGLYRFVNGMGHYISWADMYVATSDVSRATLFQLMEVVGKDATNTVRWQLYRPGATRAGPNKQNGLYWKEWNYEDGNNFFEFIEYIPELSNEGQYKQIIFETSGGKLALTAGKDGRAVAGPTGYAADNLWVTEGTKEAFTLKSSNGLYLTYDKETKTFGVSTEVAAAVSLTYVSGSKYPGHFTLSAPEADEAGKGLALRTEADGTPRVVLGDAAEEVPMKQIPLNADLALDYSIEPKRSWYVKRISDAAAGDATKYRDTGYITPDDGWTTNPYTRETIQRTSDYELTFYLKPGETRNLALPTMKRDDNSYQRLYYQRWYDYRTGLLLDRDVVNFDAYQYMRLYKNGLVMGENLQINGGSQQVTRYFDVTLPLGSGVDDYKVVAVDISPHTDFVDYFGDNGHPQYEVSSTDETTALPNGKNLIEPTLSGRIIYTIRSAAEMAARLTACASGSDKWIEAHTVHMPARTVQWYDGYTEVIPLEMTLDNYWYYRGGAASEANLENVAHYDRLEFVLENNTAGITLEAQPMQWGNSNATNSNLLKNTRFIRIGYPVTATSATARFSHVTGDRCDLKVYAKDGDNRYQLAVFHLYFDEGSDLRPAEEIVGMKEDGHPVSQRSPEYLETVMGAPVAEIDFAPIPGLGYQSYKTPPYGNTRHNIIGTVKPGVDVPNSYAYPISYANTSYQYSFIQDRGNNSSQENVWGTYSLVKRFKVGWGYKEAFYPISQIYANRYPDEQRYQRDKMFMYIDASEMPGRIAELDFDGDFCKGTRLYVSAWLGSPTLQLNNDSKVSPAAVMFRFMGYDAAGNEYMLYQFSSGNVCDAALLEDGTTVIKGDDAGRSNGVWQQVFFSFVNNHEKNAEFVRYSMIVDNNCYHSQGGDILIDQIQVFAKKPTFDIAHSTPACGANITLSKITTDFDALSEAFGFKQAGKPEDYIPNSDVAMWFCVLDKQVYEEALRDKPSPTTADYSDAFRTSLVGDLSQTDNPRAAFHSIKFPADAYSKLSDYRFADLVGGEINGMRRLDEGDGVKRLVMFTQFSADKFKPDGEYYIVFVPVSGQPDISTWDNAADLFQIGSICCLRSEFLVTSPLYIYVNADAETDAGGEISACANETVTLRADLRGVNESGETFLWQRPADWWFDYVGGPLSERKYPAEAETPDFYLTDALMAFRTHYPGITTLDGVSPVTGVDEALPLTQAMIDYLRPFTRPVVDSQGKEVHPAPLQLHRYSLDLCLRGETGQTFPLTLIPEPIVSTDSMVCTDTHPINIRLTSQAPAMVGGFSDVAYPEYMHNVPLRLGLQHVAEMRTLPSENTEGEAFRANQCYLRFPLRDIQLVDADGTLRMYPEVSLSVTNDPRYLDYVQTGEKNEEGAFTRLRRIGTVHACDIAKTSAEPYLIMTFDHDFEPREGYSYTMKFHYREEKDGVQTASCEGSCVADLLIVPQYAVWTGAAANTDWSNDRNWARADRADLLRTDNTYLTNTDNGTSAAFTPLSFTNVVLPPAVAHRPALYATDPVQDSRGTMTVRESATADIEYHMTVEPEVTDHTVESVTYRCYDCDVFATNRADGVTLRYGGELIGAHRLTYRRAWFEYSLSPDRWYTLSSPLQQTYAGEWYLPRDNGRQSTPYFEEIRFGSTLDTYTRFLPAVYQRSWDRGEARVHYLSAANGLQSVDVAVRGTWSAVFNDVVEAYTSGFSVKYDPALCAETFPKTDAALFRLPKADTEYRYVQYTADTERFAEQTAPISRDADKHYRLVTDAMTTGGEMTLTARNAGADNPYYLIGNPFPCGMDMTRFFDTNTDLERKYWLMTAEGQQAVIADDATWIAVGSTGVTDDVTAAGQGFFVKKKVASSADLSVKYTESMMCAAGASEHSGLRNMRGTTSGRPILRITATRGDRSSRALVVLVPDADNDYREDEDLESFIDDQIETTPFVYTLAGHRAATVNRRADLRAVPLGVESGSEAAVTVTFSGVTDLVDNLYLYDRERTAFTPVTEGLSVTLPGRTAGRYLLTTSDSVAEMVATADLSIRDTRGGVMVNGSADLGSIEVYDVAGRRIYSVSDLCTASHFIPLSPAAYVVNVRGAAGRAAEKVVVR